MHNNLSGKCITAMPNLTEVSNLLFRCGNADILHHRILRLFLTIVPGGLPCEHPFLEAVKKLEGGEERFHCIDCKRQVNDPAKVQREVEKRQHFLQQQEMKRHMRQQRELQSFPDSSSGAPLGVSIAWLVQWTREHNCWHMPTWLVRRLYVLPLTSQTHCCYAELPHMQQQQQQQQQHFENDSQGKSVSCSPSGVTMSISPDDNNPSLCGGPADCSNAPTGPAHTFICHKWADLWGDLVQAVSHHSDDWSMKVYIDIFSRDPYQLPAAAPPSSGQQESDSAQVNAPSSETLVTMRKCQAFLLVCPSLDHLTQSQSLSQHLSPLEADKLASPHFWNYADRESPS
jgi:hypothetical protein